MHVEASLAALPAVSRFAGSDRRRRAPAAARPGSRLPPRLPEREVTLLEANARKASFLERVAADFPNARVVRGRAEEQDVDTYGVAVARLSRRLRSPQSGACRSCDRAAEWCSTSARPPTCSSRRGGEPARRRGARGGSAGRSSSPRWRRPRPAFRAAPEWPASAPWRSSSAPARTMGSCPARSSRSRTRRAAWARRRQPSTSPLVLPTPANECSSWISTRRPTRPPVSASGRTARRATTCWTGRRWSHSPSRRVSGTSISFLPARSLPARPSSFRCARTVSGFSHRP